MEFSLITCKICNQEHTAIAENMDNLWKKLCMLCKHEMKRTNQFLAQVEKSSAFLLHNARIIESAVKMEPEEQIGEKKVRLWINSDKIVLGPEQPSASPFIEDNYSSYRQNSPPLNSKLEYSDKDILPPEPPVAFEFVEDNYGFCGPNSLPIDLKIEYDGMKEEISHTNFCNDSNVFTSHNCDEIQEERNEVEPSNDKPEDQEFLHTKLKNDEHIVCNSLSVTKREKCLKENNSKTRLKCEICQRTFLKNSSLTRHMTNHTSEKPFESMRKSGHTRDTTNRTDMKKVLSTRDKAQLLYEGYKLREDRTLADGSTAWRCTKRECQGRLKIISSGEIINVTDHNHAPDPEGVEASKIVAEIRQRATTTTERPREIILQSSAGVSLDVASRLPVYSAAERIIQRKRKRQVEKYGPIYGVKDVLIPDVFFK